MQEAVQKCRGSVPADGGVNHEAWKASHQKEADYQKAARLKRKVQALKDGLLLPQEADDELESFILQLDAKKSEFLKPPDLTAEEKRRNKLYAGPTKPAFVMTGQGNGVKAFLCPGVQHAPARDLGMVVVQRPDVADVIVAENLQSLKEEPHLRASLRGSYVLSPATLRGQPGFCIKFAGVGRMKRFVWASQDFKEETWSILSSTFVIFVVSLAGVMSRAVPWRVCEIGPRRILTSILPCGMLWMTALSPLPGNGWTRWTSFCWVGDRSTLHWSHRIRSSWRRKCLLILFLSSTPVKRIN